MNHAFSAVRPELGLRVLQSCRARSFASESEVRTAGWLWQRGVTAYSRMLRQQNGMHMAGSLLLLLSRLQTVAEVTAAIKRLKAFDLRQKETEGLVKQGMHALQPVPPSAPPFDPFRPSHAPSPRLRC